MTDREMTLEEYVGQLPEIHMACLELSLLQQSLAKAQLETERIREQWHIDLNDKAAAKEEIKELKKVLAEQALKEKSHERVDAGEIGKASQEIGKVRPLIVRHITGNLKTCEAALAYGIQDKRLMKSRGECMLILKALGDQPKGEPE